MPSYIDTLSDRNIRPNIVVFLKGKYFAVYQPDSGLVVDDDKVGLVKSLTINPTTVDPARPSTTISSISFALLDTNGVVSSLFMGENYYLTGEEVRVYLGRIGLNMDFSSYYLLPRCYISRPMKNDGSWNFSTQEKKDRIDRTAFSKASKLGADILPATTIITVQDVTKFRSSGLAKLSNDSVEFFSYSGIDPINKTLTGCIRGTRNTIPLSGSVGDDIIQADQIQANPIDILISLLVSSGGGGTYDTLIDGAKIDQSLIDITQMLDVKSNICPNAIFDLALSGIDSLQQFIENEILFPLNLRLRTNANSKIGLAVLNRTYLDIDSQKFNHDNIVKNPAFDVSDQKIFNRIKINWDYNDSSDNFLKTYEVSDSASITHFGEFILEIPLKGPKSSLNGLTLVQDIANQFLMRLASPQPEITLSSQIIASTALIGDKIDFESSLVIDNTTGLLALKSNLEVISRSINYQTGDVQTRLAFTWYSGMRQCFISPTDKILSVLSQQRATIVTGRTGLYRKTWVMRLWDDSIHQYASSQNNVISDIIGDDLIFQDPWGITLTTNHRFVFADHDQVVEQQKKFCFIDNGGAFFDGGKQYQITT